MNRPLHELAKGFIYEAVARYRVQTGKAARNNGKAIMPPSAGSSSMTCMLVALVFQIQAIGRQGLQPVQYLFANVQGNISLNGLTLTLAYTPAAM